MPTPETPTVRPASESLPQATVAAARMPWKTPYAVSTELSPAPPWAMVRPVTKSHSRAIRSMSSENVPTSQAVR